MMRVLEHESEIVGGKEIDGGYDMGRGVRQSGGRRRYDFQVAVEDLNQELRVVEAFQRLKKMPMATKAIISCQDKYIKLCLTFISMKIKNI